MENEPVITGGYGAKMEFLRRAIEVLYGERAEVKHIDFIRRMATFRYGQEFVDIKFSFTEGLGGDMLIHGTYYLCGGGPYISKVRVTNLTDLDFGRTKDLRMCWAGTSYEDRRWEPDYIDIAENRARELGIGLSEFVTGYKVT